MKNMVITITVSGIVVLLILVAAVVFQKINMVDSIKSADKVLNKERHTIENNIAKEIEKQQATSPAEQPTTPAETAPTVEQSQTPAETVPSVEQSQTPVETVPTIEQPITPTAPVDTTPTAEQPIVPVAPEATTPAK